MQQLHFGKIEGLVVQDSEPLLIPAPRIIQEIKLGVSDAERPRPSTGDFALKHQVTELFEHFDRFPDRTVVTIEVRHGLPARLIVVKRDS